MSEKINEVDNGDKLAIAADVIAAIKENDPFSRILQFDLIALKPRAEGDCSYDGGVGFFLEAMPHSEESLCVRVLRRADNPEMFGLVLTHYGADDSTIHANWHERNIPAVELSYGINDAVRNSLNYIANAKLRTMQKAEAHISVDAGVIEAIAQEKESVSGRKP